MAKIICVDGLGGCPEITFKSLQRAYGHEVVLVDTSKVVIHQDRVRSVLEACTCSEQDFFLVGQSAGGSAVRIASTQITSRHLKGVVMLSPAMPFGIWFLTFTLLRVLGKRLLDLLLGKKMYPTEDEYKKLTSSNSTEVVTARTPISGNEARQLAFYPPGFSNLPCPVLHIWGTEDQWISPRAQKKLLRKFKEGQATSHEVAGVGHLTLASDKQDEVVEKIKEWLNSQG